MPHSRASAFFGASSASASGNDQSPPQMPEGGRFSSSTSPFEITTSIAIRLRFAAARARFPGSSSMRPSMRATQSCDTGQSMQRGFFATHTSAPRSIMPCV